MEPSVISIVPPLLTVALVFFTRNVVWSLIAGVFSGAFIVAGFSPLGGIKLAFLRLFEVLELANLSSVSGFIHSEKLLLFMFLLVLGMVIATIAESGEGYGYVESLSKKLRSRSQAQLASIFLSFTLFIDDYLNALTTSTIMRGLTDKFRIPRIKLAFLTTAMAAPLCSLVPISSWAAAIMMFLNEAGIRTARDKAVVLADPFVTLAESSPYMFFCVFVILAAIFVAATGLSYGVMAKHEDAAGSGSGDSLFGNAHPPKDVIEVDSAKKQGHHSPINFFAPLMILSGAIFVSMMATGGFFTAGASLVESLKGSMAELSLLSGACVSLIFTMLLFFGQSKINCRDALRAIRDGILMMKDSLIVLTLAWTLASFMTLDLHSGPYIAKFMMPLISREFLPLSIFLIAGIISFSIGSAWATMAVLFPVAIPMVPVFAGLTAPVAIASLPSVYPVIGSLVSGSIFGSSLSPIADLLVIASKNTQVNHFDYVKAQIQYLLPVGVGAALSFGIAGVLGSWSYWPRLAVSAVPGFAATAGLMTLLSKIKES